MKPLSMPYALLFFLLHLTQLPFTSYATTPQLCYYAANSLASEDIVPCYTSTSSTHYSCCRFGNKCLRQNACYDSESGVTYQYGCTDATYQDPHCPKKCNLDTTKSRWVGMVYCNGTVGLPNNTWLCHHPQNCGGRGLCADRKWSEFAERLPDTWCKDLNHEEEYVAARESGILSDIAALPVKTEISSWWSAHADRTASGSTSTVTVSGPVTPGGSGLYEKDASPLNSKKLALGLGVGLGIPILLLATFLILFYIHKYRERTNTVAAVEPIQPAFPSDEKSAMPALGYKAELDGSSTLQGFHSPPAPSEMEGSSVAGTPFVSPVTVHEEFGGVQRGSGMKEERGTKGGRHELAG